MTDQDQKDKDPVLAELEKSILAITPRARLLKVAKHPRCKDDAERLLHLFPEFKFYPPPPGFAYEYYEIEHEIALLEQRFVRWTEYARWREHINRDEARQAGTRKKRRSRWPELDAWIEEHWRPGMTYENLWDRLPESWESEPFYRDGDIILDYECRRSLTFSGFRARVRKIKAKLASR